MDIEIICVNDGATDNSREIPDGYGTADPRVRGIEQKNSVSAWNRVRREGLLCTLRFSLDNSLYK